MALPTHTLRVMLSKVALAIGEDDNQLVLQSALLELNGHSMRLVATDGHRMAVVQQDTAQNWAETAVLIPGDALDVLRGLLSDFEGPTVEMAQDTNRIYFYAGARVLQTQKLAGSLKFPNWQAVIASPVDAGLPLHAATTLGALRRSLTFADGKTSAIKLHITAGELTFISKCTEVGESEESVEIVGGIEALAGFNGKYIVEFLHLVEENFTLHIKDKKSAAHFVERLDSGLTYRYVVMPLDLRD